MYIPTYMQNEFIELFHFFTFYYKRALKRATKGKVK